jgi:hypothetical protein
MSGVDFSNVQSLTTQIEQLKQNGTVSSSSSTSGTTSPDNFILQTEQNFNSMLQNLMSPADSDDQSSSSSDLLSSLTNDQTLQAQIQTLTNSGTTSSASSNLTTLGQTSQLLGKQATYQDQTGAQTTGVIAKILLDQKGNTLVEMTDGLQISVSAILGIK